MPKHDSGRERKLRAAKNRMKVNAKSVFLLFELSGKAKPKKGKKRKG